MATTPVILYTSAGMPMGSFAAIAMVRVTPASVTINGTSYSVATAPTTGGLAAGGTALGNYLAEKLTLSPSGKTVERMGAIGEDADFSLLRTAPKLTCTLQAASIGTPSLMPGDAFEAHIGMTAASTGASPASIPLSRWVLETGGINYDGGDPTKFQCTFRLDRQNSATTLQEF